jgi:hypothetical protein
LPTHEYFVQLSHVRAAGHSTLKQKRTEISGVIAAYQARIAQARHDLAHINASIRLWRLHTRLQCASAQTKDKIFERRHDGTLQRTLDTENRANPSRSRASSPPSELPSAPGARCNKRANHAAAGASKLPIFPSYGLYRPSQLQEP